MDEPTSKKWDRIPCEVEFNPEILKSHYDFPVFRSTESTHGPKEPCARVCIRCDKVHTLQPCSNCGNETFVPGRATDGTLGIFCFKCERGFTSWTCENCKTENPVSKSLAMLKQGGCFIATAVYGPDSPEVRVLRRMRERHLSTSRTGRLVIRAYERFSPPLAGFLRLHTTTGHVVRTVLLDSIVALARSWRDNSK
jgi:hypothetical protein